MTRKKELQKLRHDMRSVLEEATGREATEEEYIAIQTILQKHAIASRSALERGQQHDLDRLHKMIKQLTQTNG